MDENDSQLDTTNEVLKRSLTESHNQIKNHLQVLASLVEMHITDTAEAVSPAALDRSLAAVNIGLELNPLDCPPGFRGNDCLREP